MYALFAAVTLTDGSHGVFVKASHKNARASLADEPGCLRFVFLVDVKNPNRYYFYEVYADEDSFQAHERSSHYHGRIKTCEPIIEEKSELTVMELSFPSASSWPAQKPAPLGA